MLSKTIDVNMNMDMDIDIDINELNYQAQYDSNRRQQLSVLHIVHTVTTSLNCPFKLIFQHRLEKPLAVQAQRIVTVN